ncbi:hypothetical protein Apa02nite_068560 [Actinoplanes palleronii]|uniref:HNH endonuclease n=1 Tax=Actinoplanes palleronii TaxID=113570 RepID=A0ABQ4BJ89_9ACTN|nr:hypothetical protein Apa02nite_068560 [Actinoplanes palleronii]
MARQHVCAEPGCPEVQAERRCPIHRRSTERARGTRQQRGYDADHVRRRNAVKPAVERGEKKCARCGLPILPGDEWALDHDDERTGYLGPSHSTCNNSAGGKAAHQ